MELQTQLWFTAMRTRTEVWKRRVRSLNWWAVCPGHLETFQCLSSRHFIRYAFSSYTHKGMHPFSWYTQSFTMLLYSSLTHFLILCFLQPWKCHSLSKGLGFPTDLPQEFEFQEGSKNYSLLQSCSIPASVHAGVYRGPIILINTIPLYLAVSHTHLKPLHESVLSSSCNDWILLIKAAKSNVTTFSPYPHEYWWLQVPENSMGQSEESWQHHYFLSFE